MKLIYREDDGFVVENEDVFYDWLMEHCITDCFDFSAYVRDLIDSYMGNGSSYYELPRNESNSGNPEIFRYEVIFE